MANGQKHLFSIFGCIEVLVALATNPLIGIRGGMDKTDQILVTQTTGSHLQGFFVTLNDPGRLVVVHLL